MPPLPKLPDPPAAQAPGRWVYFVCYRSSVKIGSARNPARRIADLQCGSPVHLTVLGVMPGDLDFERELHKRWAEHRLRGEWFSLTPEIRQFIKQNCSKSPQDYTPTP